MRKHFCALSMGNGEISKKEVQELITRLEEAFSEHSGLQQGQGMLPKQVLEEGKERIKDTVIDIATALGIRKGEFEVKDYLNQCIAHTPIECFCENCIKEEVCITDTPMKCICSKCKEK